MPGTFVMAPDGTVRLAFVDPDYTHRLEPAAILAALRALAPGRRPLCRGAQRHALTAGR